METRASLTIELWVDCPNSECENYINLMDERDTDYTLHDDDDDDAFLTRQILSNQDFEDFECNEVTCTQCKTTFDVKGLD